MNAEYTSGIICKTLIKGRASHAPETANRGSIYLVAAESGPEPPALKSPLTSNSLKAFRWDMEEQ